MPNITIYINRDQYLKLCNRAALKNISETLLAKEYIEEGLKDEGAAEFDRELSS